MARKIDPAKHDAVLQAARVLFKEKGVEDTTIAQIAVKAGIATGTVYLYFKSKSIIIDALCDMYLLGLVKAITPSLENPDMRAAIADGVHTAFKHASANADLVRLLDYKRSLGANAGWPQADIVVQDTLRKRFKALVTEGSAYPYHSRILAELVGGLIEWVTKICFVWSDVDPVRYEDTLVELLCHAILKNYKG
jgi:AcrR family transcriptional regulator